MRLYCDSCGCEIRGHAAIADDGRRVCNRRMTRASVPTGDRRSTERLILPCGRVFEARSAPERILRVIPLPRTCRAEPERRRN